MHSSGKINKGMGKFKNLYSGGDDDDDDDDDALPVVVAVRGKDQAFAVYVHMYPIYIYPIGSMVLLY